MAAACPCAARAHGSNWHLSCGLGCVDECQQRCRRCIMTCRMCKTAPATLLSPDHCPPCQHACPGSTCTMYASMRAQHGCGGFSNGRPVQLLGMCYTAALIIWGVHSAFLRRTSKCIATHFIYSPVPGGFHSSDQTCWTRASQSAKMSSLAHGRASSSRQAPASRVRTDRNACKCEQASLADTHISGKAAC